MPLKAVLFDMDGVITDTASAHAEAWTRLFDEYLRFRSERDGEAFRPFDPEADYRRFVDGKPRYDGVRSFLASRGIELPPGSEEDGPDRETIRGLGNRKNDYFNAWLAENRVRAFPGAVALIHGLRAEGIAVAVFSSSRNAEAVLRSAGVLDLFDAKVDGGDMAELGLPGKPDPAILDRSAALLGVGRDGTAVVEDAISGVEAAARGRFAPIIGVSRDDHRADLMAAGADIVVDDLAQLGYEAARGFFVKGLEGLPSARERMAELLGRMAGRRPVVFLDYDGTLSPIVRDPAAAVLSPAMKDAVAALAERHPVAIVSGRDLADVRGFVSLPSLYYAGSHGFEMAGPGDWHEVVDKGRKFLPELDRAEADLRGALAGIDGAVVERKAFSLAVHYRNVDKDSLVAVDAAVQAVMPRHSSLRTSRGKMVFDVKPRTDWHKGRAVQSLLERIAADQADVVPFYLGDDVTDEDAFEALADRGISIVVRDGDDRPTSAHYALDGVGEVEWFLRWLAGKG